MRTILVIRSSAMGDVAMTAPVIQAALATYPNIRIIMLTRKFYAPFFGDIERFEIHDIQLGGTHKGVLGVYKLYKEIDRAHKIDFIIDLNDKLYSKLLRSFFAMSGIKSVHIDKGRREKKELTRCVNKVKSQLRTSIMRYVDTFRAANYPVDIDDRVLHKAKPRPIPKQIFAKETLWIGIAPFAQHSGKVLNIETTKRLIELLEATYPTAKLFVFGGGESELKIATELDIQFKNCCSAVGKMNLKEEMDLISNLDLMVSMDSSAMHISSLVGVKVVSIWGATHPFAGFLGMGQSLENVVQIDDLDCRPCSVYGHKACYRKDYACLRMITAEMILGKIKQVIENR